jgi:hypothetical protein
LEKLVLPLLGARASNPSIRNERKRPKEVCNM